MDRKQFEEQLKSLMEINTYVEAFEKSNDYISKTNGTIFRLFEDQYILLDLITRKVLFTHELKEKNEVEFDNICLFINLHLFKYIK